MQSLTKSIKTDAVPVVTLETMIIESVQIPSIALSWYTSKHTHDLEFSL